MDVRHGCGPSSMRLKGLMKGKIRNVTKNNYLRGETLTDQWSQDISTDCFNELTWLLEHLIHMLMCNCINYITVS